MLNNITANIDIDNDIFETKKCPAVLLIDISQSVQSYSEQMTNAVEKMFKELVANDICLETLEIGIITFNRCTREVRPIKALNPDENYRFDFKCIGRTNIGSAVMTALYKIQERVDYYHSRSSDEPYVPKLIIITDAKSLPSDKNRDSEEEVLEEAYTKINKLVSAKELCVLPIGVGERVDTDNLYKLGGGNIGRGYVTMDDSKDIDKFISAIGTSLNNAAYSGEMLTNQKFMSQVRDDDYEDDFDDYSDESGSEIKDSYLFN